MKITLWALGIVVAVAAVLYRRLLTPSGSIDRYAEYYYRDPSASGDGAVKVTFLGATTLLLDDDQTQLMVDGFFTRPSLLRVATSKLETDPVIVDPILDGLKLDRLEAVFVAHSHYDHALDSSHVVQRIGEKRSSLSLTPTKLYGSASTLNIGRGADLLDTQMVEYEPNKELVFGRFRVTVLTSEHTPPTLFNNDLGEAIETQLSQPARFCAYKEGGSYDLLVKHGKQTILIKPSTNYRAGALKKIRADVVFLGTGRLGKQDREFQDNYYDETVGTVEPKLVIPIHWDDFFRPLSAHLDAPVKAVDDLPRGFDFLIERTNAQKIAFRILQGYQSLVLFTDGTDPLVD